MRHETACSNLPSEGQKSNHGREFLHDYCIPYCNNEQLLSLMHPRCFLHILRNHNLTLRRNSSGPCPQLSSSTSKNILTIMLVEVAVSSHTRIHETVPSPTKKGWVLTTQFYRGC